MKILVVDDDEYLRNCIKRDLERHYVDAKISCAENGLQGLTLALSELFDFVLCDIQMPTMNGLELLRAIKQEKPGLQVILMTGNPMFSREEAIELGAFQVLRKPFVSDELLHTTRHLLDSNTRVSNG